VAEAICFYFDQHIPSAVALGLRQRGVNVLTAQQAGRCGLSDADQLQFASEQRRTIMTYDPDYLQLAASGISHAGIKFCHSTKYSVGALIQALLVIHGVMSREEMRNLVEYL
jgi:hypothetical protein